MKYYILFFLAIGLLLVPKVVFAAPSVYWGAYIAGNTYGLSNPPWNWNAVTSYEANTKKKISVLHWGQRWYWSGQNGYPGISDGHFQLFETATFEKVRLNGVIPYIDWNSWAAGTDPVTGQTYGQPNPNFKLSEVYSGKFDTYIKQWATDAKNWGYPFFLRFNHEMNGNWYSYSEKTNGNATGDFVKAWKHVHNIFTCTGDTVFQPPSGCVPASNVTWVWCPNVDYAGSIALEGLYPGDTYVDWTCMDGYNASSDKGDSWKSFSTVFKPTYDHLLTIAPNKPIMIGETGSSKDGGSKSAWIIDALSQLPNFPKIKALVWFNWDNDKDFLDWPIEGNHFDLDKGTPVDTTSINAFASGIGSSYYATNSYASLPKMTKIFPLPDQPTAPTLMFGFSASGITGTGKTESIDLLLRSSSTTPIDLNDLNVVSNISGVFKPATPISLTGAVPGTYEIFIKDDSHLRKRLGSITIVSGLNTAPSSFDSQVLLAGDFNGDNIINAVDLALLLAKYTGLSVVVNSTNQKFDVNLDGKIDQSDVNIVVSNFNSLKVSGQ